MCKSLHRGNSLGIKPAGVARELYVQILVSLAKCTLEKQFAREIMTEVEELLISIQRLQYIYFHV